MSISVQCSACHAKFQAKPEWVGRKTKCPKCAAETVVTAAMPTAKRIETPSAAVKAVEAAPAVPVAPPATAELGAISIDTQIKTSKRRPKESAKQGEPTSAPIGFRRGAVLFVGGGAIVAGLVCLGVWLKLRDGAKSPSNESAPTVAAASDAQNISTAADTTAEPTPVASPTPTAQAAPVAEELADVVERIKPGIVLFTVRDAKGEELGLGTGFIVSPNGLAVTNHHVVAGGSQITAGLSNGSTVDVRGIVTTDEERDLAVVQLGTPQGLYTPLRFADEVTLRQGAKVIAVGHPRGLEFTVTEGIISAVRTTAELPADAREFLDAPVDQQWIQTTAAISGGNSGGPLMLPDGRVIGINTWVAGGENLGFAGHVRHVKDTLSRVGPRPSFQNVAAYNKAHGGLKRAEADMSEALAVGLPKVFAEAEAIDWQATTEENIEKIEIFTGGVTLARSRGSATQEIEELGAQLAGRMWDYVRHVERLNAFAVDSLADGSRTAMLYGRISSVDPEDGRRFRLTLAGRAIEMTVAELQQPKPPHRVGDRVVVFGVVPEQKDQTSVPTIVAGLVENTTWSEPPSHAALREAADLLSANQNLDQVRKIISNLYDGLAQVSGNPDADDNRKRHRITMNRYGHRLDAVQLPASTGKPDDDLAFFFSVPPDAVEDWGIASAEGIVSSGFFESYELTDYKPSGAAWPADNLCRFQRLSGTHLKNSTKHFVWFKFRDSKPVDVHISAVYRRSTSIDPGSDGVIATMMYPPAPPTATRRLAQRLLHGGNTTAVASNTRPAGSNPSAPFRSASASSSGSTSAAAPEGSGPTFSRIDLPGYKPEEMSQWIDVATAAGGSTLDLINPDQPAYSAIAAFEVEPGAAAGSDWNIVAVTKSKARTPVATLKLEAGKLKFRWVGGITRAQGGPLRNCVLRITNAGRHQAVVLRTVRREPALRIDLIKDLIRVDVGEDLPAEAGLQLAVDALEGAANIPSAPLPKTGMRVATFYVLKEADADVPGARLRAVLWNAGRKPEVIIRPELTPVASVENLAAMELSKGTTGPKGAAAPESFDPTISNDVRFLPFTVSALSRMKQELRSRVAAGNLQMLNDDLAVRTKSSQIASYNGFVGTAEEIDLVQARIARLQNEIIQLRNRIATTKEMVAQGEVQLAAFPPLEAGKSLSSTAQLHLRVVYWAGEYEIPLLQVGGPSW